MRKKTLLLNAGILFLTTVIILTSETVVAQLPDLTIDDFKGGIYASAVISNKGDTNATNIHWNTQITGEHLFFSKNTSGIIPVLTPNASMIIKTGPALGLGKIFINATATCAEGVNITVFGKGLLLLFLMVRLSIEPIP